LGFWPLQIRWKRVLKEKMPDGFTQIEKGFFQGLVGPLILSLSLSKTLRLKIDDDDGLLDERISIRMNERFRSYLANRSLSV